MLVFQGHVVVEVIEVMMSEWPVLSPGTMEISGPGLLPKTVSRSIVLLELRSVYADIPDLCCHQRPHKCRSSRLQPMLFSKECPSHHWAEADLSDQQCHLGPCCYPDRADAEGYVCVVLL